MPAATPQEPKNKKRRFTPPADAAPPEEREDAEPEESAPSKPAAEAKAEEPDFDTWLERDDW